MYQDEEPVYLEDYMAQITADLGWLREQEGRVGSTYVGPGATAEAGQKAVERQRRKSAFASEDYRVAPRGSGGGGLVGAEFLRAVKAACRGNPDANRRLSGKAWTEGGNAGFLVTDDVLPQMVEMRRASAPLAAFCSQYRTDSDTVTIITEGNAVQVAPTGEGVTKLDSTGTVGTKVSTVHKLAGTSHVSDELLADARNLESLVSKQFFEAVEIAQDKAIIAGTGVGEPTGIYNTVGVLKTPVSGQTGQAIYESVLSAISRRTVALYQPTVVVMHPRDLLKLQLQRSTTNEYLFPSLSTLFGDVQLVADPNIPVTLGASSTESIIIVGDLRSGAYVFSRQPTTIDASSDAAFLQDLTVFRAVRRWGFTVVKTDAVEILTGVLP